MGIAQTQPAGASQVLRLGLRARLSAAREARLTSEPKRRRLAEALENAVTRAGERRSPLTAAIPVNHGAVREARGVLLDLAERLRAPRAVAPVGVRLARELLVDGTGPLYVPAGPDDLRAAALRALAALDGHGGER